MSKLKTVWLILLPLFFLFFPCNLSFAQTELTVSINVGDTILTLSGKTSPSAQVTIVENGAAVGTMVANSQGDFTKSLTAQEVGIHNIGIYATDDTSVTSSTVNYSVSLTQFMETTLSNIVLPPTISLSGTEIAQGNTVDIYGYGAISSTISLSITGQTGVNTNSNSSGYWKYSLTTGNLTVGNYYNVYGKVTTSSGYQSESSQTQTFRVKVAPTAAAATSAPQPTTAAASTSVPAATTQVFTTGATAPRVLPAIPEVIALFFDIDGSGRIEITEIFEAVKIWVDEWKEAFREEIMASQGETLPEVAPTEAKLRKCDINRDGRCDLFDLSILLYYIER